MKVSSLPMEFLRKQDYSAPVKNALQGEESFARKLKEAEMESGLHDGKLASSQVRKSRDIASEIARDPEKKRLYDAALEFQALFVNRMLKEMRSTLKPEKDLLHGGRTQEIFEDLLYDEYSNAKSKTGGVSLAGQHPAFRGWYFSHEINAHDEKVLRIYEQLADHMNEGEGKPPVPPTVSTGQIRQDDEWRP